VGFQVGFQVGSAVCVHVGDTVGRFAFPKKASSSSFVS